MAKSLQEQFLKSGLVSSNQAKKNQAEKRKQAKQQRKNKISTGDETRQMAERALAEKAVRDRELNRQRQLEVERKAVQAQIRQLIDMNKLAQDGDGDPYRFSDNGTVKQVYISAEMREQIACGRLAVAKLGDSYSIIPAQVARKIQQRDKGHIIVLNAQSESNDKTDDLYVDYEVPDDLMW